MAKAKTVWHFEGPLLAPSGDLPFAPNPDRALCGANGSTLLDAKRVTCGKCKAKLRAIRIAFRKAHGHDRVTLVTGAEATVAALASTEAQVRKLAHVRRADLRDRARGVIRQLVLPASGRLTDDPDHVLWHALETVCGNVHDPCCVVLRGDPDVCLCRKPVAA